MAMSNLILPKAERQRRDASVKVVVRRGQLTAGTAPRALDRAFLQRLRDYDDSLDLYWHPVLGHWVLYRMTKKAAARADDELILISGLTDHPGDWVIELCRRRDITKRHPEANTPERAAKLDMDALDAADEARERRSERDMDHIVDEAVTELGGICRARESVRVKPSEPHEAEHPKRKVIWSDGRPRAPDA